MDNITASDIQPPNDSSSLISEIHCYSLPYGGLGFVSHVLTYYAILCLCYNRAPLWPRSKIKWPIVGVYLAAGGLVVGPPIAIYTMVKCRNHWQLLLIALWQLIMSLFNGLVGVHTSRDVIHYEGKGTQDALWWTWLYVLGMVPGAVGLISLAVGHWRSQIQLRLVTYAFGGLPALAITFMIIGCFHGLAINKEHGDRIASKATFGAVIALIVLPALYSDWALGVMSKNLSGYPSSDNAPLFWAYWVAKRFTMVTP